MQSSILVLDVDVWLIHYVTQSFTYRINQTSTSKTSIHICIYMCVCMCVQFSVWVCVRHLHGIVSLRFITRIEVLALLTKEQDDDHCKMEDSHWMASLREALYAWKKLLGLLVGACHLWTRSSWMRTTNSAPPSSITPRTEPSVKIWKSSGGMLARVWIEKSLCW